MSSKSCSRDVFFFSFSVEYFLEIRGFVPSVPISWLKVGCSNFLTTSKPSCYWTQHIKLGIFFAGLSPLWPKALVQADPRGLHDPPQAGPGQQALHGLCHRASSGQ